MKTILFDDNCALCRNLAQLAARQATEGQLTFEGWHAFHERRRQALAAAAPPPEPVQAPPALGLWDGERLTTGSDAWAALLAHHPTLKPLGWLAAKVGLAQPAAHFLDTTSRYLRRLCTRCGS